MIVTVLAGRRRGEAGHQDGGATLYVSTGEGDDLIREVARLILGSRAMRHSGSERHRQSGRGAAQAEEPAVSLGGLAAAPSPHVLKATESASILASGFGDGADRIAWLLEDQGREGLSVLFSLAP